MEIALGAVVVAATLLLAVVMLVIAVNALRRSAGKHGTSGSLTAATLELQSLLEPDRRHVLTATQRDESEEDEDGDPPEP